MKIQFKRRDKGSVAKYKTELEYDFMNSQIFNRETSCYADICSSVFYSLL